MFEYTNRGGRVTGYIVAREEWEGDAHGSATHSEREMFRAADVGRAIRVFADLVLTYAAEVEADEQAEQSGARG